MINTEHYRQQLAARRDDLRRRLLGIETELGTHNSKDWEELAVEREEDEMLEGMGQSGMRELRQIDAALQRIKAGEYGICTNCGTEITPQRLDLLPHTPFCAACAP